MTVHHPFMVAVAVVAGIGLVVAYRVLNRRRTDALAAAGLSVAGAGRRRHLPPLLMLAALVVLLLGGARPEATLSVPRTSGTVILAFDVSNSMSAEDIAPSRLDAAQDTAIAFVQEQPDTVDIGVVAFSQGALTTHLPTNAHPETVDAINRLRVAGGTSLGQAILGSLTAIVGQPVTIPDSGPPPDLGYWPSASIVLLTDGEDTGGPDALLAAEVAANAGVHVETVGVGTVEGSTVEIDGYQVATSLNEDLLTEIAGTTGGAYHRAQSADALDTVYQSLDLRTTLEAQPVELTGAAVALALLLLTVGGLLMTHWFGRIL
jgi:Ca-activated chloride channel family protein